MFVTGLIVGLFVGAIIGFLLCALMVVAGEEDKDIK